MKKLQNNNKTHNKSWSVAELIVLKTWREKEKSSKKHAQKAQFSSAVKKQDIMVPV